jgi:hypothetical protein
MTSSSILGMGNMGSAVNVDQLLLAAGNPPQPNNSGGFRKVLGGIVGAAANIFAPGMGSVIGKVIGGAGAGLGSGLGAGGGITPMQAIQMQQQMNMEQEVFTTASTILKDRHDAAMCAIQNAKSS